MENNTINLKVSEAMIAFNNLQNNAQNKQFNGILAYKIAMITLKLKPIVEEADKARKDLIEKYGLQRLENEYKSFLDSGKSQDSDEFKELEEKRKEATTNMNDEFKIILDETEQVVFKKFNLSDFEKVDLPPTFFMALTMFIKNDIF